MSRFKHQICKPLYQIKAYRTSYQTIPNILKQMNCEFNFSRLLNANAQITFWMLHVKANFVFRLFNAFLYFRGQIKVVKTNVSAICHIQFQWKVTEPFWNRIKKKNMDWSYKNRSWKNVFTNNKFADTFLFFLNLRAIEQIPFDL